MEEWSKEQHRDIIIGDGLKCDCYMIQCTIQSAFQSWTRKNLRVFLGKIDEKECLAEEKEEKNEKWMKTLMLRLVTFWYLLGCHVPLALVRWPQIMP